MDAVEYLKQKKRMCDSYNHNCKFCPMWDVNYSVCAMVELKNPEEAVDITKTWADENPAYLNADKFKETFGIYATELWAMQEERFLEWLNSEYKEGETE